MESFAASCKHHVSSTRRKSRNLPTCVKMEPSTSAKETQLYPSWPAHFVFWAQVVLGLGEEAMSQPGGTLTSYCSGTLNQSASHNNGSMAKRPYLFVIVPKASRKGIGRLKPLTPSPPVTLKFPQCRGRRRAARARWPRWPPHPTTKKRIAAGGASGTETSSSPALLSRATQSSR